MDQSGQWSQSPSGSGAENPWPEEYSNYQPIAQAMQTTFENVDMNEWNWNDVFTSYEETGDYEEDNAALQTSVYGTNELPHGALMSTKIPPAWNGRGSWFAFEELVYDWQDSTVLDKTQRGPALKLGFVR